MQQHSVISADRLGRPLRDLRISVTDRCNFRCPYCMPAEIFGEKHTFLSRPELLSYEEIVRVVRAAVSLGVRKVRITGGEPLLRRDLRSLVGQLAAVDGLEDIALTTNGTLLDEQARPLADAGLRRVTVSLDSLDADAFRRLSGRDEGPERVLEGIEAALAAGLMPLKINCVVVRGINDASLPDIVRTFGGTGAVIRFIEYMDVGTMNGWSPEHVVPAREILDRLETEFRLQPIEPAYRGEVARRYRCVPGGGEVGIVSSVTAPFCQDCTRLRLSSDGKLVTCLFAEGGTDIRELLRGGASESQLRDRLTEVWNRRTDRYSELRAEQRRAAPDGKKIEMYRIGG